MAEFLFAKIDFDQTQGQRYTKPNYGIHENFDVELILC